MFQVFALHAAIVVLCQVVLGLSPSDTQRYLPIEHKGFVFAASEYAPASIELDSAESDAAMIAFANATSATHVRVVFSLYMASQMSVQVYAKTEGSSDLIPGSPFRSSSVD